MVVPIKGKTNEQLSREERTSMSGEIRCLPTTSTTALSRGEVNNGARRSGDNAHL